MQGVIRRLPKAGCELPNGTGYWAKYTDMRAMMPVSFDGKLVVAISSRALFNLADSHRVYLEEGLEAFQDYQTRHEDDVLEPGDAFPLVQKLLAINELKEGKGRVEVILLSRNSSDTGLRVFNSIEHYGLPITRAAFAGGQSPHRYVSAFGAHLFLSTDPDDVQQVLEAGYAAATILSGGQCQRPDHSLAGFLWKGPLLIPISQATVGHGKTFVEFDRFLKF